MATQYNNFVLALKHAVDRAQEEQKFIVMGYEPHLFTDNEIGPHWWIDEDAVDRPYPTLIVTPRRSVVPYELIKLFPELRDRILGLESEL